jgi:hypothetical protein
VTPFTLTEGEKATPLWHRLKAHLQDRLDAARARNDAILSEPETAALRGEIKALKALIRLGDPTPRVD